MGTIIPFEKYREKLEKKETHKHNLSEFLNNDIDDKSIKRLLNAIAGNVEHIIFSPEAKEIEKREEEDYKDFKAKYEYVFKILPHSISGRIKHYAKTMLDIVPNIFHGTYDERFNAYMDFSKFYYGELDAVASKYRTENKKLETDYPFTFEPMNLKDIENNIKDCLKKIIKHIPEKTDLDKTEIMYQLSRLFELDGLISDIMTNEIHNTNNNG